MFKNRTVISSNTFYNMVSSALVIRKLIFHYRNSKLRRSIKLLECFLYSMAVISYVTKISERRREGSLLKSCFQLLCLKNSVFDRGWMRVNKLTLILVSLIFFCTRCSVCSPVPKWAKQEITHVSALTSPTLSRENVTLFSDSLIENLPLYNSARYRKWNNKYKMYNFIKKSDYFGDLTKLNRNNVSLLKNVHRRPRRKPLLISDKAQNYLMNFGYIPPSDIETGNLRTDEQLREAIRNLQNFANIPVTGELDENTLQLMKKPRCGLPDIPYYTGKRRKRYTLHGQKWHYTNLTWSLRTYHPRNLDPGRVRSELHRALSVWSKHSKLTFEEINSDRADILVYFERGYHGDGYAFDGIGQILAHAFFPGGGRGGDAHFDEDENWILDPYADMENVEGTSLFAVAAHEFGHSLGLSHSSVQESLMFPWYQVLPPNFELPEDDKHGIQQLYGAREEKLWAKISGFEPFEPQEPPRIPKPTRPPPREPSYPKPSRPYPTHRPRPRPTVPPTRPTPPRIPPTRTDYPRIPPTKPSHPRLPPKVPPRVPGIPDTCDTSYDAISVIRGEVFIFKDKYLWRIGDNGLLKDYPAKIERLWYGLPENFTRVDAVYERSDKKIVFFIGKMYYVFNANHLVPGYPRALHHLGLPRDLEYVDAAMVWGHNGKTYFFSGTMYWRFDEETRRVELDYPRDMSMWKGVGYNIDTVFQWKDGITYFFKGKGFWKFNDLRMRVENERQMPSAQFWMGCPRTVQSDLPTTEESHTTNEKSIDASRSSSLVHCHITAAIFALLLSRIFN